jgi:redox-sensitive bicupin YhaK (pirin superfamily)
VTDVPPPVLPLAPHAKDLGGGFTVRRLLPAATRQAVGPFVFFDHFGPITAGPADNHDVRPHPHIGLATVTYLFEGAILHHDSTGARQRIEPGAINWMTAGRGVVHSERTPEDLRGVSRRSHGLQLWAALPAALEDAEPSFAHTPAAALPVAPLPVASRSADADGSVKLLIGSAFGMVSPLRAASPTLFADIRLAPGVAFVLDPAQTPEAPERAVYVSEGAIGLDGEPWPAFTMAVLPTYRPALLTAGPAGARLALIGGAPLGHRYLYWNFVSTRRDRLVQAADDWAAGRFPVVEGETDFIPLPERRPA